MHSTSGSRHDSHGCCVFSAHRTTPPKSPLQMNDEPRNVTSGRRTDPSVALDFMYDSARAPACCWLSATYSLSKVATTFVPVTTRPLSPENRTMLPRLV